MSIDVQLNDLLDEFSSKSSGLFELTGKYTKSFEQGLYGCAFIKPSKRMRTALGVDLEILLIASTFTDQQQRTIKFAIQEIQESKGRLEKTMAIILHRDRSGNVKLRNWGRDVGISILPVQQENLKTSEILEKVLCNEIYSHDPFDITGPVSDDSNFYGRRDEAIDLARKLQKGQIRTCLGIRKIGKTSILNRIIKEIKSSHDCVCIMIDCSKDDVWSLDASSLMNSIANTLQHSLDNQSNYENIITSRKNVVLSKVRKQFENTLKETKKPFILVLDEVDYITPGSPTNKKWHEEFNIFWRNLRAVYQECSRQDMIFSVLIAGVSAQWFTVESIDGVENAALAFVPEEYLTPMPLGASAAMLRRLGKIAGLQLDDDAANYIANETGNMPYWSRKCGSFINRKIDVSERPCEVSRARIEPLVHSFVQEEGAAIAEVALKHLFRVYPSLFQPAIQCKNNQGSAVNERDKRILRRYGVLKDNQSIFSGKMMSAGFDLLYESEKPEVDIVESLIVNDKIDLDIDEWAEELAVLNKRRNLLERRLREITLNFIRYDAMHSSNLPELTSRIIKIIPDTQRAHLAHLSATEILSKFMWTDLVKLITKEWRIFEKLFGDKSEFINHCGVINERYDAHAKNADAADFAMYRRSLKYVEERISKLH